MLGFLQAAALSAVLFASSSSEAFSPSSTATGGGRPSISHDAPSPSAPPQSYAAQRAFATSLRMSTRGQTGRDFYQILGVSRSADAKEIKSAYRKLAKQYHPDANPGEDTTEKFQEINRAYEVLNNPDMKQKYDMFGELEAWLNVCGGRGRREMFCVSFFI